MSTSTESPSNEFHTNEDSDSLGNIKIALHVVANIVRLAAFEVPGVIGVGSGFVDGLAEIFTSRQNSERGVKIEEPEPSVYHIEIRVIMLYGSELAKVALQLQSIIKERVAAMTGAQVRQVDVVIDGVRLATEKASPKKGSEALPQSSSSEQNL
jgi:uncharacterized alkaline shock family protein YloU